MKIRIVLFNKETRTEKSLTLDEKSEGHAWINMNKNLMDGWVITMIEPLPSDVETPSKD